MRRKFISEYPSGSRTHDQDFAQVEAALLEVMERHPEVYLKLVGILDESGMERVQNRIEKLPFMDWRQLPAVIAGLDINLMPLEDSLFHCCKSENKWTEAALVKVPSIMSCNREMEYVIENGKKRLDVQNERRMGQCPGVSDHR